MAERGVTRGIFSEFEEMRNEMQRRFGEMMTRLGGEAQQMPFIGETRMTVDVREHEDEVRVVMDLPGVDRQNISVRLVDPRTLKIQARREEMSEEEQEGYYMQERSFGAMSRTVALPAEVTEADAQATYRNGVLEVRLAKTPEAKGREISVSEESGALATEQRRLIEEEEEAGRAAELRRQKEQELEKAKKNLEPGGYTSSEEIMEQAKKMGGEKQADTEEARRAAELRKQKEQELEEAKKKLGTG
jgi:HSP20 family protein